MAKQQGEGSYQKQEGILWKLLEMQKIDGFIDSVTLMQ